MKPLKFISSLSLAIMGLYLIYQGRPVKPEDQSVKTVAKVPTSPAATTIVTEATAAIGKYDFKQQLEVTLKKLPTKASLQALTAEEAHSTPQVLKSAAFEIGQIQSKLKSNPELKAEAFQFYKSCAEKSDLASQVRALCYHYGRSLGEFNAAGIPENVKDLAKGMVD